MKRNCLFSFILVSILFSFVLHQPAFGDDLPSSSQFSSAIKVCAEVEGVKLDSSTISLIERLYNDQDIVGPLGTSEDFLSFLPEADRFEAYKLYVLCISKILGNSTIVAPTPTTSTYTVCTGDFERSCPRHDVYLPCFERVESWAKERCGAFRVLRLSTITGNRCGYALDEVICTGTK
jgi:hypothetical protein